MGAIVGHAETGAQSLFDALMNQNRIDKVPMRFKPWIQIVGFAVARATAGQLQWPEFHPIWPAQIRLYVRAGQQFA